MLLPNSEHEFERKDRGGNAVFPGYRGATVWPAMVFSK
jgi:hypothetical protein